MSSFPWRRDASNVVSVTFKSCGRCGRQSFPPQPYGCVGCGAHELADFVDRDTTACGQLVVAVDVYATPDGQTRYRIGEVHIDGTSFTVEGPVADGVAPGDRVTARIVTTEEGAERFVFDREEVAVS